MSAPDSIGQVGTFRARGLWRRRIVRFFTVESAWLGLPGCGRRHGFGGKGVPKEHGGCAGPWMTTVAPKRPQEGDRRKAFFISRAHSGMACRLPLERKVPLHEMAIADEWKETSRFAPAPGGDMRSALVVWRVHSLLRFSRQRYDQECRHGAGQSAGRFMVLVHRRL